MKIPWNQIAKNLPAIIGLAVDTAERFKKPGAQKEAEAIATVKKSIPVFEGVAGDVLNDPAIDQLLAAYIQARVALMNAVNKKTEGVILPQ